MAPVKQVEGKNGEVRLSFTGQGYALIALLAGLIGGGTGLVATKAEIAPLSAVAHDPSARPDPYTGTEGKRDREYAERERNALRREMTEFKAEIVGRFDKLEQILRENITSSAYCCARVNSLEREVQRHTETGARP